jgi:hypothetical protein
MNDDAQAEDRLLERPEPLKAIQPALFATPVTSDAGISSACVADVPSACVADVPSACVEGVSPSSLAVSSSSFDSSEQQQPQQQQQDADKMSATHEGETPSSHVEATTGSHPGQFAPIVLFRSARRHEPAADEIEQEEIVAQEPIEEDLPVEELAEELSEQAAPDEPTPAREQLQPVAVGAERQSNNNQETDSWLF